MKKSAVKPKTLRLEPTFEVGLGLLKQALHKPVNKMVNEAVGEYIARRTAEVEADLGGVLARLKAYRRSDPDFKRDRNAFIAAEAEFGASDPMEGVVYKVESPREAGAAKTAVRKSKPGPALSRVRELLRS